MTSYETITGRWFFCLRKPCYLSTCIWFSSGVPAILPYLTNQSFFTGFHLPPAVLACNRSCILVISMRRGTRASTASRGSGRAHAILSTINSTVFTNHRFLGGFHSPSSVSAPRMRILVSSTIQRWCLIGSRPKSGVMCRTTSRIWGRDWLDTLNTIIPAFSCGG